MTVECAHSDRIWACGIRLSEEDRHNILKWIGQNLLGFALMEVRDSLPGEKTMGKIAEKYGVTVAELKGGSRKEG